MQSRLLDRPLFHRLFLAAAMVLLLAPFLNKPVNIDDPLFIWMARQIHHDWLDPYGFTVNWYSHTQWASDVIENPPLASYYMAAAASVLGWSDPALHTAFLLPAVALILGVYELARRHCERPVLACLIALSFPVVLVSATTLMCDLMMLALWVWAIVFWETGLRDRRNWAVIAAGLLMGAAGLTKYFAAALIPLALVYGLALRRRPGWWLLGLLIPVAMFAAYARFTLKTYGHDMLLDAFAYASGRGLVEPDRAVDAVVGLAFTGGCLLSVLFYAPLLWRRRVLLAGVAAAGAAWVVLLKFDRIGAYSLPAGPAASAWRAAYRAQFALALAAGLALAALVWDELRNRRQPGAILLLLWCLGTFVFASILNWTTNGRSILPMAPAVAILIVRRLETRLVPSSGWNWRILAPLAPALALTLLVACADQGAARSEQTTARRCDELARRLHLQLWFQGHWGFQYYMEKLGHPPLETIRDQQGITHWPGVRPSDLIVIPKNSTNTYQMPPDRFVVLDTLSVDVPALAATMSQEDGAGFYSTIYGPLPFVVDPLPQQVYFLCQYRPGRPTSPPTRP